MFSFREASRVLGVETQFQDLRFSFFEGASIDSRKIEKRELFVALPGSREDGHRFLADAFRRGASGALVRRDFFLSNQEELSSPSSLYRNLLPVEDPQTALGALAAYRRLFCKPLAIGITGSVGKTSTKEFLSYLLTRRFNVLSNAGNFNNHLGLPLTLLRLRREHQICVAELGANHKGEIRCLADFLKPQHAIITRISPAHLSGFGSLQGIYEAKLEILEPLSSGGIVILPDDDQMLLEQAKRHKAKIITVGQSKKADYWLSNISVRNSSVHFQLNGRLFIFPGLAGFLAQNAAMAAAMAERVGFPLNEIPERWDDVCLPDGRFQEHLLEPDLRLIYDGYNASPASFEAALDAFDLREATGRKFLVFADMLELGEESSHYHERLGRKISRSFLDCVLAYGPNTKTSIEVIRQDNPLIHAEHFQDPESLAFSLMDQIRPGDLLLLKASRGMKMDKVLELLRQKKWSAQPQSS